MYATCIKTDFPIYVSTVEFHGKAVQANNKSDQEELQQEKYESDCSNSSNTTQEQKVGKL